MPAMTSADVLYSQVDAVLGGPGRVRRRMKVIFPSGATNRDYPAGGVPLLKAALGCPRGIASMKVVGRTVGAGNTNPYYEWNGDAQSPTLVAYETAVADAPFQEATFTAITQISQIITVEVEGL